MSDKEIKELQRQLAYYKEETRQLRIKVMKLTMFSERPPFGTVTIDLSEAKIRLAS